MPRRLPILLVAVLLTGGVAWAVLRDDGRPAVVAPTTTSSSTTTTAEPEGTPGPAGAGDPYFPELGDGGYDVEHYTLDLSWLADQGQIDGLTTVVAVATQDLSRFNLDLVGLEVTSVIVDGRPAAVERSGRELVVVPSRVIPSGRRFTTKLTYGGTPTPVLEGTTLFRVGWQTRGREAYVVSEPAGAATFFPVNDHPADKATYTIRVSAPADQTVAANGLLAARDDIGHGMTSWTYEERAPMASYLVQVVIGDYELVDAGTAGPVRIRHAFHRPLTPEVRAAADQTSAMLEVLSDAFGPYPFEVYGVAVVDEPLGFALETETLTIVGSDLAARGRAADPTFVHELAHQWFGDSVSVATWKDIWLNEGFATYAEWLYSERTGGPSARRLARRAATAAVDLDLPPGDPGPEELFPPSVYLRGAMTLQALREAIGDDAFFRVLRAWADEHAGSTGSTEQLIALAERESGQPLHPLFLRWLYADRVPSLG